MCIFVILIITILLLIIITIIIIIIALKLFLSKHRKHNTRSESYNRDDFSLFYQ